MDDRMPELTQVTMNPVRMSKRTTQTTFSLAVMMLVVGLFAQILAILRISPYLLMFVVGSSPALVLSYCCYKKPDEKRIRVPMRLALVISWVTFYVVSFGPVWCLAECLGFDRFFFDLYWPVYWVQENTGCRQLITEYSDYWRGYSY